MRLLEGRWFLLVAAIGWASCSFDSGRLRTSAKPDASDAADLATGTTDGKNANADTLADLPDALGTVEDADSAPAFETLPDVPGLPPTDAVAFMDADAAPSPADSRDADTGSASDTPPIVVFDADLNSDARDDGFPSDGPPSDGPPADGPQADGPQADGPPVDRFPVDRGADTKDSAAEAGADGPLAPSCGGPGQLCCAGNACSNSGCCVGGACAASGSTCPSPLSGTCSNGACGNCGGTDDGCCEGSFCTAANTFCQTGTYRTVCAACGGDGDPCCLGNFCLDGGCCIPTASGSGTATCKAAGLQCSPGITATCSANACGTCGGLGNACCSNSRCTAPNTFCQTATTPSSCVACGGASQPCCPNPTSGDAATCSAGFACQTAAGPSGRESCVACGGDGQPCCGAASEGDIGTCETGNNCEADYDGYYSCAACGASGESCCAGNTCTTGTCRTYSGTCP